MGRKKATDSTPESVVSPDKSVEKKVFGKYVKVTYSYKRNRTRDYFDQKTRKTIQRPVRDFEKKQHVVKVLAHEVANGNVAAMWCQRFNERLQAEEIDNAIRILKIEPWTDEDKNESSESDAEMKSPVPDGAVEVE